MQHVETAVSGRNPSGLRQWAERVTRTQLAEQQSRLAHSLSVARQGQQVRHHLRLRFWEGEVLVAAALLHDVGYSKGLRDSGFHPIDGARFVLRATGHQLLTSLVAHHSHASVEARIRGLASALQTFGSPTPTLADALTYCDMTVGPHGQPMSVDQRLADIHDRYEPDHVVARAVTEARPLLLAAVHRTEARIRAATADGQRRTG